MITRNSEEETLQDAIASVRDSMRTFEDKLDHERFEHTKKDYQAAFGEVAQGLNAIENYVALPPARRAIAREKPADSAQRIGAALSSLASYLILDGGRDSTAEMDIVDSLEHARGAEKRHIAEELRHVVDENKAIDREKDEFAAILEKMRIGLVSIRSHIAQLPENEQQSQPRNVR